MREEGRKLSFSPRLPSCCEINAAICAKWRYQARNARLNRAVSRLGIVLELEPTASRTCRILPSRVHLRNVLPSPRPPNERRNVESPVTVIEGRSRRESLSSRRKRIGNRFEVLSPRNRDPAPSRSPRTSTEFSAERTKRSARRDPTERSERR